MKKEIFENSNEKSLEKQKNHIEFLKRTLYQVMDEKDLTIEELAELCDISFASLKTLLYDKEAKDCRVSTLVKLSKGLKMPVGLLIGTLDEDTADLLIAYRSLPPSSRSLIEWTIKHQKFMHEEHKSQRIISVMQPICNNNGNMKKTNIYEPLNIDNIGNESLHRIFMGIKIPCEHHLPHYMKGDILLIANDRDAHANEHSVIIVNDNMIITKRVVENGKPKYYGIRDNVLRSEDDDRIYVLGYIVKVISE